MSRLIESIRLHNGVFSRLNWHQQRISRAFNGLFNTVPKWNLIEVLKASDAPSDGFYKCRLKYNVSSFEIEFELYHPKTILTLKIVDGSELNYSHKFEDRSGINDLYKIKGNCDDILITKNEFITDSSFANIVFKKNNNWFTPDTPLLAGTMRQFLLDTKVISVTSIRKEDIMSYECFKLINSMLEWESPEVPVSNIILNNDQ